MLGVSIPEGALFYGEPRRRTTVGFSSELRARTQWACARMHELYRAGASPPPIYEAHKCDRCSLFELCQPIAMGKKRASRFLDLSLQRSLKSDREVS